jgi:hypothetical protein
MNEDYIDRMNRAKKVDGERDPFIREGNHTLCLLELYEYMHEDKGAVAKARFLVLDSKTHAPGSTVCKLWFLQKPGKFKDSVTDSDRFADFILKLKGVDPEKDPNFRVGGEIRRLLRNEVFQQPERGRVLLASGRNVAKADKEPFIDVSWKSLQQLQTPEQIAAERAKHDANEATAYSRQLQKTFRDIQAMQGMQPAPHAAQQPQYAPQGYQGQAPAPQQGGYGQQQWNQQNPNAGVNPQYAPQPAPGYGQPMQSPVPPQGAPQQPAYGQPQQGGFTQQIPPQGPQGGWNGGNGNGGQW